MKTTLAEQVNRRNQFNALHNRIVPIIRARLEPFLGQKVIKADNSLTAKVAEVLNLRDILASITGELGLDGKRFQIWHQSSSYSLSFTLRDSCYLERELSAGIYVFEVQGQVAEKWFNLNVLPTYSETEVAANVLLAKDLQEKLREVRGNLGPFDYLIDR